MLTAGTLLGALGKVAPSLLGVAKHNYAVMQEKSIFRLGESEAFPLSRDIGKDLEVIAALESALQLSPNALEELLASKEFEVLARRLLALQWDHEPPESVQERSMRLQREAVLLNQGAISRPDVLTGSQSPQASLPPPRRRSELPASTKESYRESIRRLLITKGILNDGPEANTLASALMSASVAASARFWDLTHNLDFLVQDAAVTSANARILADEITAFHRELDHQVAVPPEVYRNYERFTVRYLNAVEVAYRHLQHPSFTDLPPIPFGEMYVAPFFAELGKLGSHTHQTSSASFYHKPEEPARLISTEELFAISYRTVILGNPGAGKSTLARKLCNDVRHGQEATSYGGRSLIPLLVILKDYAIARKESGCSVVAYAERFVTTDWHLVPPVGFFERLLLAGRILVIFDGLDELLDAGDRLQIRDAVQQFADLYPAVPVFVTSREVGYDEAPLDSSRFETYRLLPFSNAQVREYSAKWFTITQHESIGQRLRVAASFLQDVQAVPELCENPLMLALLCNLYRRDSYLPTSRADVYERCADLLFEKWDKARHIIPTLPEDYYIRPLMRQLAAWIYQDPELQQGVTEVHLIEETSSYLKDYIAIAPQRRACAAQIVSFFNGRSWLFTDVGSTRLERLYKFTHRTFLEYFAAEYFAAETQTAEELVSTLIERVVRREWELVCSLAFQLKAKRLHKKGTDSIVQALLTATERRSIAEAINIFITIFDVLRILRPTLMMRDTVVSKVASIFLRAFGGRDTIDAMYTNEKHLRPLLTALLNLPIEGGSTANAFLEELSAAVQIDNERAAAVWEIAEAIQLQMNNSLRVRQLSRKTVNHWNAYLDIIIRECMKRTDALCSANLQLCCAMWWRDVVTLPNVIRWHGVKALFVRQAFGFEEATGSIAEYLLVFITGEAGQNHRALAAINALRAEIVLHPDEWRSEPTISNMVTPSFKMKLQRVQSTLADPLLVALRTLTQDSTSV